MLEDKIVDLISDLKARLAMADEQWEKLEHRLEDGDYDEKQIQEDQEHVAGQMLELEYVIAKLEAIVAAG